MAKSRLQVTHTSISLFADRLRFDSYMSLGRFHLGLTADLDSDGGEQCPVGFDLPLKDREAFERAAAAFNKIMDEHEIGEAAKNVRRRQRYALRYRNVTAVTPRAQAAEEHHHAP